MKDVNIDDRKTLAGSYEHGGCRKEKGIYWIPKQLSVSWEELKCLKLVPSCCLSPGQYLWSICYYPAGL
jgi:hypothetical protein